MSQRFLAAAAAALLLVCAPAAAQDENHPILRQVREIQEEVERLRGLSFQAPVKVGVQKPDTLRNMLTKQFEEEAPLEEMAKQERVIKALGLIPQDYDLRGSVLKFLSDQIGGFYDPEKKELFLIDRSAEMQGLEAMSQGMNDKMVMAHELHHALQDQNFALDRWFEVLGDHEDRVQAYKSLVEGEAQLVGMTYLFGSMGRGKVDMKSLNRMQDMMMKVSPEAAKFRDVPPYLLENMMFPYTQGAEFVQEVQRKAGWDRLAQAFNDPPTSTEQVLHPEKFLGTERDEPMEIVLPGSLIKTLGEGAEELYENTLGEFTVTLLLRALGLNKAQAARAAAGWDGDRFAGFGAKDGRVVVVWLSTWDSEDEAEEFGRAYADALAKARPDSAHVERHGREVLLVDGATAEERAALAKKAFRALKVEQRLEPLPGMTAKPERADFTGEETVEAAPATPGAPASATASLVRLDDLGLSLVLPPGFAAADEPIEALKQYPSAHFTGPDGARLRVVALPIPLASATDQFEALVREGLPDVKITDRRDADVAGRKALALSFAATLPYERDPSLTRVRVIDAGPASSLALALSAPNPTGPEQGRYEAVLEDLLGSTLLDGAEPLPQVTARGEAGVVTLGDALGGRFEAQARGPVFCSLEGEGGARAVVVTGPAEDLEVFGARLEAQIPLLADGAAVHAAGVVSRKGAPTHEIEFEVAGRRTRQVTFLRDGRRWSLAVSAPSARFEALRARVGQLLASFRVESHAASTPGESKPAPEAPKRERKAY